MSILEPANLGNLFSLYRSLGNTCNKTTLFSFERFTIIQGKGSVWPNMAFDFDEKLLSAGLIDDVTREMKALELRPTMILNYESAPLDLLKAKGYLPVDQWLGMSCDVIENQQSDIGQARGRLDLLQDNAEVGAWTKIVSETLFGNKTIDPQLFTALHSNGAELIGIRIEDELAGSSMIHFDEYGLAGIYMVGVKAKYRGKGLGKELIRHCINRIQKRGIDRCCLQATRLAIDLYKTLGFKGADKYLIFCKIK